VIFGILKANFKKRSCMTKEEILSDLYEGKEIKSKLLRIYG